MTERQKWGMCWGTLSLIALLGVTTAAHRSAAATEPTVERADRAAQAGPTGQQTFDRVCGRCHPHGNEDIGPRILGKNIDSARMLKQIRQGTGRMRAISLTKLPEAQMPALMDYLRSTLHAVH
jgi:cytochrome c5